MDYQTALAAVTALPIEEQERLIAEVQGQLDDEDWFVPAEELNAELDGRVELADRPPGRPWTEVLEELRAKHALEPSRSAEELVAELIRRSEEFDRNPQSGVPWEVVEARLRAKYLP